MSLLLFVLMIKVDLVLLY